jgi:hypothetical protein
MLRPLLFVVLLATLLSAQVASTLAATPIELVATGTSSGNSADRSQLHGKLEDGTPANRLGSWGSGIAYAGQDDLFVVMPDRGPNASSYNPAVDNTTSYPARVQTFRITVNPLAHSITLKLIETQLLIDEAGKVLRGLSSDHVPDQPSDFPENHRIDPEGVRVSNDRRHYYVSDEYGPSVFEFDAQTGRRTRVFSLPARFAVLHPAATGAAELAGNTSGRQANHGLEGLAITPDGRKLVAILQAPLLQDTVVDKRGERVGINVRLLTIDIESGKSHEYLYQLADSQGHGVSEIVAVNSHEFLVLERDTKAGDKAACKSLFLIDLDDATDIGQIDVLPHAAAPAGIRPVAKHLFLDLLDPQYGLAGQTLPAKIEGLAFGPDLADGRHLLLISTDNDFQPLRPSRLFAFAIRSAALPHYEPQQFSPPRATKIEKPSP